MTNTPTRTKTLKVTTKEGTQHLPVNWSFLSLGDSRVYEELEEIKRTGEAICGYSEDQQALIDNEIKRLENLGFKVEVTELKEIEDMGIKHNGGKQ